MTKDDSPTGRPRSGASREAARGEPIDKLRAALDAAASEPAPPAEQVAPLKNWIDQIARAGVLRRAPLSPGAIDLLAQALPEASVTSEFRARIERARLAARAEMMTEQTLEAQCPASSPPELFRSLRERAGMSAESTADLFGVAPEVWIAVEQKRSPWYRLRAEAVPAFAVAVAEPVDRLIALIALTARRAVYAAVESRTHRALGRFDEGQAASAARRDHLRMAFARVEDENRGAAEFLEVARRVAGEVTHQATPPSSRPPGRAGH